MESKSEIRIDQSQWNKFLCGKINAAIPMEMFGRTIAVNEVIFRLNIPCISSSTSEIAVSHSIKHVASSTRRTISVPGFKPWSQRVLKINRQIHYPPSHHGFDYPGGAMVHRQKSNHWHTPELSRFRVISNCSYIYRKYSLSSLK